MSKRWMGYATGVSLALLLGAAVAANAQVPRPRPGVPPVIGRQPAPGQQPAAGQQPTGPAGAVVTTQVPNMLLPCCVVEGVEQEVSPGREAIRLPGAIPRGVKRVLVVRDTKTGKVERMRVSGASSAKYRPGQAVAMNLDRTALAITPFPVIDHKKSEINGKSSWKMTTDVTVSINGRMDGKTKTKSSEALRGFTGGVEVVLTDRAGNILYQTRLRTYGVNGTTQGGGGQRTETWSETVPAEALNKVSAVVIHHSYEPKVKLAAGAEWLKNNWDVVVKVFKCGAELLAANEEDSTGSQAPPPPPPPAPGQTTTQPPPSDTSTLGCIEATTELIDSLY